MSQKDVKSAPVLSRKVQGTAAPSQPRPGPVAKEEYVLVPRSSVKSDELPLITDVDAKTSAPLRQKLGDLGITDAEIVQLYSGQVGSVSKWRHYINGASTYALLSTTTTPPIVLSSIGSGTAVTQRLSPQILIKTITVRGILTWNTTYTTATGGIAAYASPYPVRLIIFVDKMPLVGIPNWAVDSIAPADIGSMVATVAAGTTMNSTAPYNYISHGTRYRILREQVFAPSFYNSIIIGASGTNTSLAHVMHFEHTIDVDMTQTFYDTSSNSQITNTLEMFCVTDAVLAGTNVNLAWTTDIKFRDTENLM